MRTCGYAMITRQRKVIEALEHQLADERERAAGERERSADERERAAGERERSADERERAAGERRQLLAIIESLTERLSEQQYSGQDGS